MGWVSGRVGDEVVRGGRAAGRSELRAVENGDGIMRGMFKGNTASRARARLGRTSHSRVARPPRDATDGSSVTFCCFSPRSRPGLASSRRAPPRRPLAPPLARAGEAIGQSNVLPVKR
eukprot:31477-Pelagococcus_subviridis.AAC.5